MAQDTCIPDTLGSLSRTGPGSGLTPSEPRCADAARMRGEPLAASAVPYRRFLLVEVPGPWGKSALDESHLDAGVVRRLSAAATANDLQVVLIRRPGRNQSAAAAGDPLLSSQPKALAFAFADTTPRAGHIRWGSWSSPADLLRLDFGSIPTGPDQVGPDQVGPDQVGPDQVGPDQVGADQVESGQRLVLVCTNGKRDRCCALRGRPVAAVLAAATSWDTWECSHLGGHRFAATMLLLPSGEMFGHLDPDSAVAALRQFDAGQIVPSHYRGRCGQPPAVQAALQAVAIRLRDFRRGALSAASCRASQPGPDTGRLAGHARTEEIWDIEVAHRAESDRESLYRVTLGGYRSAASFQSCADTEPRSEIRYQALAFARLS